MSAPSWRERREAYLRECGLWVDLIREGYVQHRLTVLEGSGRRRERGESPALVVAANTAPHREGSNDSSERARGLIRPLRRKASKVTYPLHKSKHEEEMNNVARIE